MVIVGGGMAGLSCAASLARRGITDVILLEAKTLAHARASSFGETRMFRSGNVSGYRHLRPKYRQAM